jgi:hypothetical protein
MRRSLRGREPLMKTLVKLVSERQPALDTSNGKVPVAPPAAAVPPAQGTLYLRKNSL